MEIGEFGLSFVLGFLVGGLFALITSLKRLEKERVARVQAETLLAQTQKLEERFTAYFKSLAAEALKNNSESFITLAKQILDKEILAAQGELSHRQQAIEALLTPLRETLERYQKGLQELENARQQAYGNLSRQLEELGKAQEALQKETQRLVSALRTPKVRGRWGEITLQRVIELAGLSPYCDFAVQTTSNDSRLRPDLIIYLPNNRVIIVDAKTPLDAYLEAIEAEEESSRKEALARYAQAVKSSISQLSSKEYQSQFNSLDFVILFLPGESYFAAAVEQVPGLIEEALQKRVLMATPITLVALLKAVALGWQQRQATENAEKVIQTGQELFERASAFAEHLEEIHRGLKLAVNAYNAAVGSWQSRLLPSARRLKELGLARLQREIKELTEVDTVPRDLPKMY
ncbi:DNA recombination protein RmuC [Thermanaeromonas toyohensis ToBE]|uniref:DNA recombination protein RmuC n=1 Tax=Thermanaeromonas toyohensis ToBE TaxID=698762 RepID=A0A1W1VWZ6_9FIRM|nr:DNA recombination protein RmuC [Thermanaeromonas toyohensis]SMB97875.1 DNA recombination protein RmuC [Thermanaeromonas toyohensis ToBE]